jgi:F-type H+-transporting ATPase subunit b
MGDLGLDLRLLLSQVVNFALVAFILHRLLHRPFLAALAARAQRVRETVERREQADRLLEEMQARYRNEIERAHREAHAIVEQGNRTAEQQRQEILAAAREEAQQIITRAQTQAQREIEQAELDLRQEIVDLSIAAATQVVGQALDEPDHRRLIEEFLSQVTAS